MCKVNWTKKCSKDRDSADISLNIQGQLQQNKQIVAAEFTRYFPTVADNIGGMEASCLTEEKCYRHPGVSAISNRQMLSTFNIRSISREEILDALRGINPHKATGFDGLSPRMLKLVADEIAEPLTVVFNQVIQAREWPKEWKRGEWVPVYKKEDPQNIANYRPVTLLPAVDKIFEQLLCYQLRDKFETVFDNSMSAYRKYYSCETTLILLSEDRKYERDIGETVAILSTDMSKAFDSVHPTLLLAKVKAYGFSESALILMKSYFDGRENRSRVGMATSC